MDSVSRRCRRGSRTRRSRKDTWSRLTTTPEGPVDVPWCYWISEAFQRVVLYSGKDPQ